MHKEWIELEVDLDYTTTTEPAGNAPSISEGGSTQRINSITSVTVNGKPRTQEYLKDMLGDKYEGFIEDVERNI